MQDKFTSPNPQSQQPASTDSSAFGFHILDGADIPAPAPSTSTNTANSVRPQIQAEIKRLMQRVAELRTSQHERKNTTEYRDHKDDDMSDDGDGGWTTASEDDDEEDKKHEDKSKSKSKVKFGDGSDARRNVHTTTSSTRVDVFMTNHHSTTTNPRAGASAANSGGRSSANPLNHSAPPRAPPRAPVPPPPFSAHPSNNPNPNPNPYSSFSAHTGIYTPNVSISHGMTAGGGGWGGAPPPPPRHPYPPPPPPPPPFSSPGPRINIIGGGHPYPYNYSYYPSGHYTSADGRTTANVGSGNVSYSSVSNCGNDYSRNYVYGEPEGNRSRRGGDYY